MCCLQEMQLVLLRVVISTRVVTGNIANWLNPCTDWNLTTPVWAVLLEYEIKVRQNVSYRIVKITDVQRQELGPYSSGNIERIWD